jgi:hypothetical protein
VVCEGASKVQKIVIVRELLKRDRFARRRCLRRNGALHSVLKENSCAVTASLP